MVLIFAVCASYSAACRPFYLRQRLVLAQFMLQYGYFNGTEARVRSDTVL
jgi:hypothetical protein